MNWTMMRFSLSQHLDIQGRKIVDSLLIRSLTSCEKIALIVRAHRGRRTRIENEIQTGSSDVRPFFDAAKD
jgi:hypothetical protein